MRQMNRFLFAVVLFSLTAAPCLAGEPEVKKPPERVGQIFIIGNDETPSTVILDMVPLYPGKTLDHSDVRQAETNLARSGLFLTPPEGGRPTVTVLNNPLDPDYPIKDILIQVEETRTGSLMFGVGVNSDVGLTGSIVLNERNFDWLRQAKRLNDQPISKTGFMDPVAWAEALLSQLAADKDFFENLLSRFSVPPFWRDSCRTGEELID
jgi:hypothetical protein